MLRILEGDCRTLLPTLEAGGVHCVVTSPPYYGLRDYGTAQWEGGDAACDHLGPPQRTRATLNANWGEGFADVKNADARYPFRDICSKCGARRIDSQIGLEATLDAYIATMVAVFREVRRVLRDDGTCWVNMGDSYNANQGAAFDTNGDGGGKKRFTQTGRMNTGLAPKQLLMMPARLALALQADGWWLRSDIIWAKPNPMPESVTDRPTSAHEHVFLLTKSARYYYDAEAIAEPAIHAGELKTGLGSSKDFGPIFQRTLLRGERTVGSTRSCRNVWTIATHAYPEAHFATFPPALAERCIKAGCPKDGTVLDPFAGAGTTGLVADRLQRNAVLIELNPAYCAMMRNRIVQDAPLFAEVAD